MVLWLTILLNLEKSKHFLLLTIFPIKRNSYGLNKKITEKLHMDGKG